MIEHEDDIAGRQERERKGKERKETRTHWEEAEG